ncbi:MAG TPA: DUF1043 family protein [Azoarcus sp.]|nr:DUF1043 family protein [Azoarcus sp.]
MTGDTVWLALVGVALVAGVIGFLLGRGGKSGSKHVKECERKIAEKEAELLRYREEVKSHFDQTASLFVSMAGSYKEFFEHLSGGYEKLADDASKERFRERVAMKLTDGRGVQVIAAGMTANTAVAEEAAVESQAASAEPFGDDEQALTKEGAAAEKAPHASHDGTAHVEVSDEIEKFDEAVRTFEPSPQQASPAAEREPFVSEEVTTSERLGEQEPKDARQ